MDKQNFIQYCNQYLASCNLNDIPAEKALSEALIAVQIFKEPIIRVADACHPEFNNLKEIIGEHFKPPEAWLPEAKSVISFFFPFTEAIRKSNRENMSYPSKGWLNGRIEGQSFINNFSANIVNFLNDQGLKSVSPSIDNRFFTNTDHDVHGIHKTYTSNWSERHVAYLCGMGTFSLSKGLITEQGTAGRLTSIITALHLPPDDKKFQDFEENCSMCGKCVKNCPVNAISLEHGKNHQICSAFLNEVLSKEAPWYGCGKCQVKVPCEYKIPKKKRAQREAQIKR